MLSQTASADVVHLVELLRRRVGEPADLGLRYLPGRDGPAQSLTFAQLDLRARAVAAALQRRNLAGERALLCYPPGLEFMVGLYGCLYAGLVAVPAYPPRAHKPDARLASMATSCRPAVVLTTSDLLADRDRLVAQMPDLARCEWLSSEAVGDEVADAWRPVDPSPDDLAILQYTSGSTGDPKGVMLTHACVLHNIAGISRAMGLGRGSIGVSWLPAFHDMGLIGNLLGVIWYPGCLHVLSPMAMLQEPFRWLDAVSQTRAYISGGPCFAFEQCLKRITAEQRKRLDLSAWKVAYIGAEPISPRVVEEFAATFAECGFRRESFYPCFGLAESSLMVTGVTAGAGPMLRTFVAADLERDRAMPAEKGRVLVGSGSPIPDLDVRVVDATGQPLADGGVGEVWVRGPSVGAGYFERPEATAATFGAVLDGRQYLRTGDLGFFHDGELFIAGRLKDLLIVRGRNFYPQDIEEVVQLGSPLLKAGGGAAFTRDDDDGARLVLVYEAQRNHNPGSVDVYDRARAAIAEEFGIEPGELVLIRAGTLPRTSSGKVARRETKQRFLAGELDVVERFVGRAASLPRNDGQAGSSPYELKDWLVARLARQLQVDPTRIDVDKPFASYGLDSLAMVQLAGDLERHLGRPLSPTLLYSAPTIASLARALSAAPAATDATAPTTDARVAVIGIGCRFPGADGPAAFWDLLRQGRLAIRDLPEGRWPAADRPLTTTRGGYLDDVRGFDAAFFAVSPREAPWIDPQHRLLLETAVHALEDAAVPIDSIAGKPVGVFVGISGNDYGKLAADHAGAEMYLATGNAASMAAHRLSYHLDLHGPSVAVDTACSSSLTAVHAACSALRNGECDLALAAGVNLILSPDVTEALSRAQMLSPDARCKTFDAAADGYVRGEGVGVVVLKPLAQATRDGDPVYAVIEATAVNQDGRSNGITAPNGAAQARLLRQALARAGRTVHELTAIETHGTGTALGDPIEFDALADALGAASTPCALGAVKANVGHLEAAAGIAGLIKAALQLHHESLAPIVGLNEVNPLIRLTGSRFHIPRAATPWPRGDRPRLIGVNSFGFGGANAHALLSDAHPTPAPSGGSNALPHLLPLSARSPIALRSLTLPQHAALADVAHTLALGRTHHAYRAVQVGSAQLTGKVAPQRVAFLFTGQGSSYPVMARTLDQHDVFRAALDRCDKVVRKLAAWSVREAVSSGVEDTEFAQPALFAFEYALAQLWLSWGVEPAAVLGHSVGEIVAACVAGVHPLNDALRLIVARGRAMQACRPGAMLACLASVEQVRATLDRYGDRLSLAAANGPRQCVLAGSTGTIAAVAMELTEQRIDTRMLPVKRAFHSPLIEPALPALKAVADKLTYHPSRIAFVSNVTGDVQPTLDTAYWPTHARATVRFEAGVQVLHRLGVTHFVEVGPAPVLTRLGATCLPGVEAAWLPSLKGDKDTGDDLARGLARLYVDGASLNWGRIEGHGRKVHLPGYPFQRREYWYDQLPRVRRSDNPAPESPSYPATTWRPRSCWAQRLSRRTPAFDRLPALVAGAVDAAWAAHPLDQAAPLRAEFDVLAGAYIVAALERLGWRPVPGETRTLDELASKLGVIPTKSRLLRRLAQLAAEDGWLTLTGDEVTVLAVPPATDPTTVHLDLLRRFAPFEIELRLAHHCARHLADVLRGTVDPLQVLFEGEAGQWTADIYSRAPVARFYNALLTRAVQGVVAALPEDRAVRVLELGAGTGGTTQALLPVLPAGRTEYAFTDVSSLFLARARSLFGSSPAVSFHTLDLEAAPTTQGFADGQFDLVVASNVLHATADLRTSVRHASRLLTPGGLLVLLEGTGPRRLLDLIFGLTEGWWRFSADEVRPEYPLISPAAWRRLLLEEGFDIVVALPENDARLADPDQVVLFARLAVTEPADRRTSGEGHHVVLQGEASPLFVALEERLSASGAAVERAAGPGLSVRIRDGQTWAVTVGEWPEARTDRVIDLDPLHPPEVQAVYLAEALLHPDREPVVAYRGDGRYVPRTESAIDATEAAAGADVPAPDRGTLLAASPFERRALVETYLRQEMGQLLGAPLSDEDLDAPVQSLGLDSLMAIQVRNRVETSLGVSVSLVDFLKGLRVRQLVDGIVEQFTTAAPVAEAGPAEVEVPADGVGGLSERELDSLLVSLLDQPREGG